MPLEIEAKYLRVDTHACRSLLEANGYTCTHARRLMRRYTYLLTETTDNRDGAKWGRIRDEGDRITMTYKHAFDRSRIDGIEEVEFDISDFDTAAAFMEKLGFHERLYQENYRETWRKGEVEVTLNEWPALAPIVEIEAPEAALVEASSKELGFDFSVAVFGGIGSIYKDCNGWDMDNVRELTFAKEAEITATMNAMVQARGAA